MYPPSDIAFEVPNSAQPFEMPISRLFQLRKKHCVYLRTFKDKVSTSTVCITSELLLQFQKL